MTQPTVLQHWRTMVSRLGQSTANPTRYPYAGSTRGCIIASTQLWSYTTCSVVLRPPTKLNELLMWQPQLVAVYSGDRSRVSSNYNSKVSSLSSASNCDCVSRICPNVHAIILYLYLCYYTQQINALFSSFPHAVFIWISCIKFRYENQNVMHPQHMLQTESQLKIFNSYQVLTFSICSRNSLKRLTSTTPRVSSDSEPGAMWTFMICRGLWMLDAVRRPRAPSNCAAQQHSDNHTSMYICSCK